MERGPSPVPYSSDPRSRTVLSLLCPLATGPLPRHSQLCSEAERPRRRAREAAAQRDVAWRGTLEAGRGEAERQRRPRARTRRWRQGGAERGRRFWRRHGRRRRRGAAPNTGSVPPGWGTRARAGEGGPRVPARGREARRSFRSAAEPRVRRQGALAVSGWGGGGPRALVAALAQLATTTALPASQSQPPPCSQRRYHRPRALLARGLARCRCCSSMPGAAVGPLLRRCRPGAMRRRRRR